MTRKEFEKLRDLAESGRGDQEVLAKLSKYKVDNAIIMAAGYSARCMPLSSEIPKGLFRVKGEILIEREIRQLKEAGIDQIIVVTGYLHEKYEYLREKFGVIVIFNEDFDKYNNIASLYVSREYMANSYILCCDNYYQNNIFHQYVYQPYYSCVYSEAFCDEFCVTELDENEMIKNIKRGGERSWYTIGDCFFNREYSSIFVKYLEQEWANSEIRNLLFDDFHIKHIDELLLYMEKRGEGEVLEFDTLEEFRKFDSEFAEFEKTQMDSSNSINKMFLKYSEIKSYHSVPTEQLKDRLHLNENLFKPSPKCLDVLKDIKMEDLYLYDLKKQDSLIEAIAKQTGIAENNIFVHNGSSEVIKSIFSILLNEGDFILVPDPGWSYYKSVADAKFSKTVTYRVYEGQGSYQYDIDDICKKAQKIHPRIIVVTMPQMPTGCTLKEENIVRIIEENPDSIIMIDEAYWGFANDSSLMEKKFITSYSNVVVTRTFSKFYGLADIRIGYGLCSYPLRRTIGLDLPLFRASGISRRLAIAAIEDKEYYDGIRKEIADVTEWFTMELNKLPGVKAYDTESNFVFVKMENMDANIVRAFMEENGILIRLFTDQDDLCLRITIAPRDIMERVLLHLKGALNQNNNLSNIE